MPYPNSYNAVVDQAKKEIQAGYKPALQSTLDRIESYDTIFVGSPNWWSTIAPPVATFLSEYDLSGKTIELCLFVASSARDTDFTGKLVDVYPDGRAMILTEGILRARYRNSFTAPELLEPDAIYELRLDLWATANVFLPGHRIRLEVSSSNFPRFDRNSNTGGEITSEAADQYRPAINRIFHDAAHPSHLILPTIER